MSPRGDQEWEASVFKLRYALKRYVPKYVKHIFVVLRALRPSHKRSCPICGYHGYFRAFGRPLRPDARCKKCESLERHRHFWLWCQQNSEELKEPILHFAPEPPLERKLKALFSNYKTADLFDQADMTLNIEAIDLETASLKTVICNHVLEHVNDRLALSEIYRVLSDDGLLICSTPIIEGWEKTYESPAVVSAADRLLHFGQVDHVRYYGRDFRDRLRDAGFMNVQEITAEGQDILDYGLVRGEKFFLCRKS
jgi:hypothetical protein